MTACWWRPRCQLVRALGAGDAYSVASRMLLVLAAPPAWLSAGGPRRRRTACLHMQKRDTVLLLATVCIGSLHSHMLCFCFCPAAKSRTEASWCGYGRCGV